MVFRETWVCVPKPQALISGSRTNLLFYAFEVKAVSFVSISMAGEGVKGIH